MLCQENPEYPYVFIFGILILCGLGLPIPEEVILISAGYLSASNPEIVDPRVVVGVCAFSILAGDSVPFFLGRLFGPKLLRLRIMRTWMHTERLAAFDRWFRRHGNKTIFVARFLTGIRVPTFFAAGSMRVGIGKFLLMDGLGAVLSSLILVWVGNHFSTEVDTAIEWVRTTERGLLIVIGGAVAVALIWLWHRQRRRKKLLGKDVRETFVGPRARGKRKLRMPLQERLEREAESLDIVVGPVEERAPLPDQGPASGSGDASGGAPSDGAPTDGSAEEESSRDRNGKDDNSPDSDRSEAAEEAPESSDTPEDKAPLRHPALGHREAEARDSDEGAPTEDHSLGTGKPRRPSQES